jgi:hypothetical protein
MSMGMRAATPPSKSQKSKGGNRFEKSISNIAHALYVPCAYSADRKRRPKGDNVGQRVRLGV